MTKPTGRPRGRPRKHAQHRVDGWSNVLLGLGNTKNDPLNHTRYAPGALLDQQTLTDIYRGDGLGARVVNLIVKESIREWIEAEKPLLNELRRVDAKRTITEGLTWARLFGGAMIVALVDDGRELHEPLNKNGIRNLARFRVYDRHQVGATSPMVDENPNSPNFGLPTIYQVHPIQGIPFTVHASRVMRLDGVTLPNYAKAEVENWGDSVLSPVYTALMNYGIGLGCSANIIRDFVQTVLAINGLSDMLRSGEDELVVKRASVIDMTRSVSNSVFIDADGESYNKEASSVAGMAELLDRFALHISASSGIPATKLLGRSPAGLNATGENDLTQWRDEIQSFRNDEVGPILEWMIELVRLQRVKPVIDSFDFDWPALEQLSEVEWAEVKNKNAQTDAIYINSGAVDPEYLYHLRYKDGQYNSEVKPSFDDFLEFVGERDLGGGNDE